MKNYFDWHHRNNKTTKIHDKKTNKIKKFFEDFLWTHTCRLVCCIWFHIFRGRRSRRSCRSRGSASRHRNRLRGPVLWFLWKQRASRSDGQKNVSVNKIRHSNNGVIRPFKEKIFFINSQILQWTNSNICNFTNSQIFNLVNLQTWQV